jgi:hypothetical protein
MVILAFALGLLCGLSVPWLRGAFRHGLRLPLGEDENYLLAAARAAKGRLILKLEAGSAPSSLLLLKEFPNPRRIENTLQIEKLLARNYIQPDPSGIAGRYVLTTRGWALSQKLPEFPLQPIRSGATWFNSISRRPVRLPRK